MKELTNLQKAVQEEMNRILSIVEQEQERGFSFTKLPSLNFDPTKARTKQLKMLRRYTRQKLMEQHSEWVNPETGEIFEGREGAKAQFFYRQNKLIGKEEIVKKSDKPVTRLPSSVNISIIQEVRQKLVDLPTHKRVKNIVMDLTEEKNAVLSAFDDMVGQAEDEEALVQYLYENEYEISTTCDNIAHYSDADETEQDYYKLIIIFNHGEALTQEQAMEYENDFNFGVTDYDYDY